MTPLEINAAGRPVIAYRAGGATETVVERVTGLFFDKQTSDSLATVIEEFETRSWNQQTLRWHAEGFSHAVFAERFMGYLESIFPLPYRNETPAQLTSCALQGM